MLGMNLVWTTLQNLVREFSKTDIRVRLINRLGRYGLSSAICEGCLNSNGDVIAIMDSDGQHEVVFGETLYSIAKKYNLSWEVLKKMNSLSVNELSVGQQLIVRETSTKQDKKVSSISGASEAKKMVDSPSDSISIIKKDHEVQPESHYY